MSTILSIVQLPESVLHVTAGPVPPKDISSQKIQKLISNMKIALKNTPDGVGLAAPQVGASLQIFIVSEEAEIIDQTHRPKRGEPKPYEKRDWKYYVFINPAVKKVSKKMREDTEGCLSVRGTYGVVNRHQKITVEAYDETGKKFIRGASNFFARVLQHELDHLSGTIFVDKAKQLINTPVSEENQLR